MGTGRFGQADGMQSVVDVAGEALAEGDVEAKLAATRALRRAWEAGMLTLTPPGRPVVPVDRPGVPERPALVHPRDVPRRPVGSEAGRAALVHAVAHIELTAVNLALDAVHRFGWGWDLPARYIGDWVRVADEEARHFGLLAARLADWEVAYGDLPAHDGQWAMAVRTALDPLPRMALVPRVNEARGLDVTPGMVRRLQAVGDDATVAVLEVILAEEVGHVEIGSRWFAHLCAGRGLEPEAEFRRLLGEHGVEVHPPANVEARLRGGFSLVELERLGLA
jgi:uncharacterized ferritin-like protein (DUF455 family)